MIVHQGIDDANSKQPYYIIDVSYRSLVRYLFGQLTAIQFMNARAGHRW